MAYVILQTLTQKSRCNYDMAPMVRSTLLTQAEADIIVKYHDRSQGLWSWAMCLGEDILERIGVPPPNMHPLVTECREAFAAVSRLEAYYDSQLAFCYVHMIVLLVGINNYFMSLTLGASAALAWRKHDYVSFIVTIVHLLLVPTMYQALLQICFLVEDPLGDDVVDFPIVVYQRRVYKECKSILKASRSFWMSRRAAEDETLRQAALCDGKPPVEALNRTAHTDPVKMSTPVPQASHAAPSITTANGKASEISAVAGSVEADVRRRLGAAVGRLDALLDSAVMKVVTTKEARESAPECREDSPDSSYFV